MNVKKELAFAIVNAIITGMNFSNRQLMDNKFSNPAGNFAAITVKYCWLGYYFFIS